MKTPRLTLVGAGPGDAELITLKAVKALQQADAVLYDSLANPQLLTYVNQDVPVVFVGKRKNQHTFSQLEINEMIVEFAFKKGHVVRLKGGDPFVFGRGFEEIEMARSHGIVTEYIPGISSSISVPGLEGIPVTHRGTSESVWVITATTSTGELSADIALAAQSNATIVILMGLGQLSRIVEVYRNAGREELPFAIIQHGSLPNQRSAIGTVNTIEKEVLRTQLESPAIIIIGEVVRLHRTFQQAFSTTLLQPTILP